MPRGAVKPALHQSTLSLLSKCGMMAYYYHVEGRRNPPGVAAVTGTATHRATKSDLRSKRDRGKLLPTAAVRDIAADAFDVTWDAEDVLLDREEKSRGVAVVRGEAKDQAVALATAYHSSIAPAVKPLCVERRLRVELEGFPFDVVGTLDVVEPSGTIRDTKTSAKSIPLATLEVSVQHSVYEFMWARKTGKRPKLRKMDVLTKTKVPKAYTLLARASHDDEAVLRRMEYAARVLETGAFYPVDPGGPSGWVCSEKFCGYYNDVCPFGRRARIQG